ETYHSREAAQKTIEDWNARFSKKKLDEVDLPEFQSPQSSDALSVVHEAYTFLNITKSRTDVRRLIEQGSVQVDGNKIRDPKDTLSLKKGQTLRLDKTRAVRIG